MRKSIVLLEITDRIATVTLNAPVRRSPVRGAGAGARGGDRRCTRRQRLMRNAERIDLPDFLNAAAGYQALMHQTKHHHEALAAVIEK